MTAITLDGLTKSYDATDMDDIPDNEIVAVEDVDLEIEDGEFLVFVGPSGCGKSTTLRCIAGLEDATGGEIRFGETVVNDLRPRDRDVAMVFQNYALYPHMTVRKNISFGLRLSSTLTTPEIDSRVTDVAEMMGIEDLLSKTPDELSGGQQQRVALGRSIVREPGIFLMDEPLSNLDAKLRAEMRTEIQELQNDLDVTTVYVTHDQTEAMAMGDRIAVLNDGLLQQVAPPEEIYRSPANEFVAGFIGSPSINFFDVSVDGQTLTDPSGFSYELEDHSVEDDTARLGIRPEDLTIEEGGDDMTVTVVEKMGNENFIYGTVGDTEVVARTEVTVRPEPGQRVGISFAESAMYLFESETGAAIKTKTDEIEPQAAQF